MAATSCEGVYESFKDAGASDFVAGVGALANIYVLNKALNQDYFKRWWAKGDRWLDPMAKDYKRVAMGVANKYMAASATEAGQQTMTKQATKGLFNKLTNLFSESILPYTGEKLGYVAGDYFKGAINEGLEEVMEEGFVDTSKAIAKVFDALGIRMTTDPDASLDFGFTVEEAGQRYLQAFVGGFGGGAIFHGINRIQKGKDLKVDLKKMDENSLRELSYIIAQGRGQEIKDYYKKLHKKGLLGSTTLSGTKFETITNADGTTEEKAQTAVQGESQNDIVYEALIQHIDYIEGMMEDEGIKVSEKYLMNQVQDTIASMMSDSFFGEEGTTNESYGNRLKQAAYLS